MSNVLTRFFCPKRAAREDYTAARVEEVREALNPNQEEGPIPCDALVPCVGCKGIFAPDGMTSVYQIIIGEDNVPRVSQTSYCRKCKPPTPYEVILEDDDGYSMSSLVFRIDDGWIQPVNDETGEDDQIVTLEEWGHTFCTDCGELIEETECKRHRAKAKK